MEETISSVGTFASPVKQATATNSRLGDFKVLSRLGEGAFSTVYRVERQADGRVYALKKVRLARLSEKEKANALNEIRVLASIRNAHVIEYKDSFFDESSNSLCIVMEYASEGDLLQKLNELKARNTVKDDDASSNSEPQYLMDEEKIWTYVHQIAEGMKSLHAMGILHRDLKCANVFIGCDGQAKIGDLNVSLVTRPSQSMVQTQQQTGTPYYTAPEIWKGHAYSQKSDVWSFGCIVYELCCQVPPFRGKTIESLFTSIIQGEFKQLPECYSQELVELVRDCLAQEPLQRPTCEEILTRKPLQQSKQEKAKQELNLLSHLNAQQQEQIGGFLKTPVRRSSTASIAYHHQHLIDTINVPSNMKRLSGLLPKANYEDFAVVISSGRQVAVVPFSEENNNQKGSRSHYKGNEHTVVSEHDEDEEFNQRRVEGVSDDDDNDCDNGEKSMRREQLITPTVLFTKIQQVSRSDSYHDLVNDSPIRMNLKRVQMDRSKEIMQDEVLSYGGEFMRQSDGHLTQKVEPNESRQEGVQKIKDYVKLPQIQQMYSSKLIGANGRTNNRNEFVAAKTLNFVTSLVEDTKNMKQSLKSSQISGKSIVHREVRSISEYSKISSQMQQQQHHHQQQQQSQQDTNRSNHHNNGSRSSHRSAFSAIAVSQTFAKRGIDVAAAVAENSNAGVAATGGYLINPVHVSQRYSNMKSSSPAVRRVATLSMKRTVLKQANIKNNKGAAAADVLPMSFSTQRLVPVQQQSRSPIIGNINAKTSYLNSEVARGKTRSISPPVAIRNKENLVGGGNNNNSSSTSNNNNANSLPRSQLKQVAAAGNYDTSSSSSIVLNGNDIKNSSNVFCNSNNYHLLVKRFATGQVANNRGPSPNRNKAANKSIFLHQNSNNNSSINNNTNSGLFKFSNINQLQQNPAGLKQLVLSVAAHGLKVGNGQKQHVANSSVDRVKLSKSHLR